MRWSGLRGRSSKWAKGILLVAMMMTGLFAFRSAGRLGWHPSRRADQVSPYRNARPGVQYVGDQACARCHEQISESFHRHSMGRSMSLAADAPTPGLDERHSRVEFAAGGLEYAIERKNGRIVHSETRKDAQGRVIARTEAEVTYEVGSGRRGRSYLIERDGYMTQSPISWYSQDQRWDLSPDSQVKNNHFKRPIDPGCLFCHSNQFEPVPGTINRYQAPTFRGLAIGCERCHGPGELHVQRPGFVAQGRDPTIVNPVHLEPRLREAVCEQCHLGGRSRVERLGKTARDYRPGLPLGEFFTVIVDRQPPGTVKSIGHVEQMHASRCYRESDGRLGCTSCHDPHQLPAVEERVAHYRARCLVCHAPGHGCQLAEPVRRERTREDSCIFCHMPRSALGNVAHTAETDHTIPRSDLARPLPPIVPTTQGADALPLAAFPSSLPQSGKEAELGRELGIALAGLGAERASDRARMARYALPLLDASLSARPDDPVAWQSKIIALSLRNRSQEALAAVRSALAVAPENELTLALAIPLLAAGGERDQAIAHCRRLLSVNPMASEYHILLAKLLAQSNEWTAAADACRAALQLDPLNLTARWILVRSAFETGNQPLARAEGEIYLRFDPPEGERATLLKWMGQAGGSALGR